MRLLYLSGARLPTEMAHGLQIMQNCEAFAAAGADVRLWHARHGALHGATDVWTYYGVRRTFAIRKLPCINIHTWLEKRAPAPIVALAFYLLLISFGIAAGVGAWFSRPDVIYGRDPLVLLVAGFLNPRKRVVWEAHSLKTSDRGSSMQRQTLRRAALTVAVTPPLRADLLKLHPSAQCIVAHDGIRAERFADMPNRTAAREAMGWPTEAFIVGYVGRLTTYNMSKGVDTLVDAMAKLPQRDTAALALVGGPDDIAEEYRARWLALGLPVANFLYAGQVPADAVPRCLAAFDVCAMPLPHTEHFAFYASPLKLFEYMASGRALVATGLPSWADVLRHEDNALLVPPDDAAALGAAIDQLQGNAALRERLAAQAQADAYAHYTWDARANVILTAIAQT